MFQEFDEFSALNPSCHYSKAKKALNESFGSATVNGEIDFDVDEIQFIPQNTAPVEGDDLVLFNTFIDMLNDLDDVQNIYHSAEV